LHLNKSSTLSEKKRKLNATHDMRVHGRCTNPSFLVFLIVK
jgi:hypothetical protein